MNTTRRIPAGWGESEKVSPAAAALGLEQSGGFSLTRAGGLISRLTFPVWATTRPFLPFSQVKTTASHWDNNRSKTRSRHCKDNYQKPDTRELSFKSGFSRNPAASCLPTPGAPRPTACTWDRICKVNGNRYRGFGSSLDDRGHSSLSEYSVSAPGLYSGLNSWTNAWATLKPGPAHGCSYPGARCTSNGIPISAVALLVCILPM